MRLSLLEAKIGFYLYQGCGVPWNSPWAATLESVFRRRLQSHLGVLVRDGRLFVDDLNAARIVPPSTSAETATKSMGSVRGDANQVGLDASKEN